MIRGSDAKKSVSRAPHAFHVADWSIDHSRFNAHGRRMQRSAPRPGGNIAAGPRSQVSGRAGGKPAVGRSHRWGAGRSGGRTRAAIRLGTWSTPEWRWGASSHTWKLWNGWSLVLKQLSNVKK